MKSEVFGVKRAGGYRQMRVFGYGIVVVCVTGNY